MLTPEAIAARLTERFPAARRALHLHGPHPRVALDPQHWLEIAGWLRDDPSLGFQFLRCITAVDLIEEQAFLVLYELHALEPGDKPAERWRLRGELTVELRLLREHPHAPSVTSVWPAADWHEREAYDLMGVIFDGHPNLTRILCPDDWAGHALRKDYEFPLEYHGIPAVTEFGQTRPLH